MKKLLLLILLLIILAGCCSVIDKELPNSVKIPSLNGITIYDFKRMDL